MRRSELLRLTAQLLPLLLLRAVQSLLEQDPEVLGLQAVGKAGGPKCRSMSRSCWPAGSHTMCTEQRGGRESGLLANLQASMRSHPKANRREPASARPPALPAAAAPPPPRRGPPRPLPALLPAAPRRAARPTPAGGTARRRPPRPACGSAEVVHQPHLSSAPRQGGASQARCTPLGLRSALAL